MKIFAYYAKMDYYNRVVNFGDIFPRRIMPRFS